MKKLSLNGKWHMTGGGFDCCGTIPGSLFSFLLDNGLMEDPYYRDNEYDALALTRNDYTFSRTFNIKKTNNRYILRFDGIDTLSDIYLNGINIGKSDNMHITYELDATDALLDGENTLTLVIHEIFSYINERIDPNVPLFDNTQEIEGFAHIRKTHCMLGWDWGPFLPDMGIWRDVTLLELEGGRIESFLVRQRHEGGKAYIRTELTASGEGEARVIVTAPCGEEYKLEPNTEWEVPNPMLWWPRGLGEQPLYTVRCELMTGGTVTDTYERRIGLRVLTLIRERDEYGESFMHECNGIRFFAMGADYIPEDNIFSRITPERSRLLLERCVDANFNAIRVWGGGYYPDDWFFDICDELGLIVFLDMAFACALYRADEAMLASIETEVRQNLTRFHHHPSIAIISGNNEVEACHGNDPKHVLDATMPTIINIFYKIIPNAIKEICPDIPYIASSPISIGHFIQPNNENFGDTHYWDVWHAGKPFTEYRNHHFRYLSEFGFQSFPCLKTVEQFTLPEDRNIFSRVMEQHQRNTSANAKIVSYLADTFLYPTDFGTLLYASQLLQAEAIKYGVEHARRERGRCMGTLYWQLNDIWPVASWASIDYYGRLKALHYYARRFYSPVLISCVEIGEKTTRPYVILDPYKFDYTTEAQLVITNDTLEGFSGKAVGCLRSSDGSIIKTLEWDVECEPLSTLALPNIDFNKCDVKSTYYSFELIDKCGNTVSSGTVLFTAPKHFDFLDPELSYRLEGDEIVISAKAYAMSVEIYSEESDLYLSDNFLDINGGEEVRVRILEGEPKAIKLRSVYDIR